MRSENQTVYAASLPGVSRYALPENIKDLFTDYTCTQLADENIALEDISELKSQYTDADSLIYLERAEQIIKGNVKYTELREFSDDNIGKNKIDQAGNLTAEFSRFNLRYSTSDLILTGIYGLTGQEIRVFVETDADCLPNLIITQNHGFWNGGYRQSLTLNKGMNVFTYSDFVSSSAQINKSEVKGGAIYLSNPYTHEQQGDIKVYIEGGGFYPVFKKGDDESAFLGMLKEYETNRKKDATHLLDMAELITDHTIITTTSSSLYDAYITHNTISPTLNLTLWGDFMTNLLEFNGIATSSQSHNDNWNETNDYININFRYMTPEPDSGAYTTRYHIGYYFEHSWFANFYNDIDNQKVYNIAHEIGHQIDTSGRAIDETTNNMTATYAYIVLLRQQALSKWQPFERGFNALSSDNNLSADAFKDGHILYPQNDIRDRNYMIWWYLESVFPNFWADLNNMYRADPQKGLTANEKMVYYSSLVTGVDLAEYYERWGFFQDSQYNKFNTNNTSETFKQLMADEKIKKDYAHFWLVDNSEFDFIRENSETGEQEKAYIGGTPTITSVGKTDEGRKIVVTNTPCASHLGYEIYVTTDNGTYKIAGFTYSNTFVDSHNYGGATPVYKAIAVNRYFKTTEYGNTLSEGQPHSAIYACRVGNEKFATLEEAMYAVTKVEEYKGKTIYLLADCHINKFEFYPAVKIEVAPEINNDITITGGSEYLFKPNYHFSLTGRENARIIIEGGSLNRAHGAFMLGSGDDLFEYVTFRNCKTADRGGAIYQIFGNVTLNNCKFINCSSTKDNCALYFQDPTGAKSLKMFNCVFDNDNTDIYLAKNNFNLIFEGSIPDITLEFPQLENKAQIECRNFEVCGEDLSKVHFADSQYAASIGNGSIEISICDFNLTFNDNGKLYKTTVRGKSFTFGSEVLQNFDDKKYIASYRDESTGTDYKTGDEITIAEDKIFNITVKDKLALNLEYMQDTSTEYFAEGENAYLPLFDSAGNKIYRWITRDNCYYAGGYYKVKQSETLRADYAEYFRVDFFVNGILQRYYYEKYGAQIVTPPCGLSDFKGWLANGAIIGENTPYTVEKDITFTAALGEYTIFDLNDATIQISDNDFTYTGNPIRPDIKVLLNNEELSALYYEIEYTDNINAGTATITVKPLLTNVTGQKSATFIIAARQLTEADVQISDIHSSTYDGTIKTVTPTVVWDGITLKTGRDYDITYLNDRINAGTVNFKISFKGNFGGDIQKSFTILKAQKPNVESTTIYVQSGAKTLADITPPANFEWVDDSMEITANKISVWARYIGGDALNYETKDILFELIIENEPAPPPPPEDNQESGTENDFNGVIVSAVLIPVILIAGAGVVFIIVRHRRNKR